MPLGHASNLFPYFICISQPSVSLIANLNINIFQSVFTSTLKNLNNKKKLQQKTKYIFHLVYYAYGSI